MLRQEGGGYRTVGGCAWTKEAMASTQDTGGRQNAAVSYGVDVYGVITCNCSRCARKGFRLALAPRETFTLRTGGENLTEYLSGKEFTQHQFCKTCGVESFAYAQQGGAPVVTITLTGVQGVKVRSLQAIQMQGGVSLRYPSTVTSRQKAT